MYTFIYKESSLPATNKLCLHFHLLKLIFVNSSFNYKEHINAVKLASYLDLHLEIESKAWLRTKLDDIRYYFNLPIVNFALMCYNIRTALDIDYAQLSCSDMSELRFFFSQSFPLHS